MKITKTATKLLSVAAVVLVAAWIAAAVLNHVLRAPGTESGGVINGKDGDISGQAKALAGNTYNLPKENGCFKIWKSHFHDYDADRLMFIHYTFKRDGSIEETSQFSSESTPSRSDKGTWSSSLDGTVLYVTWDSMGKSEEGIPYGTTPTIESMHASSFTTTLGDTAGNLVATCTLTKTS
jgi:hypothetical protein